MKAAGGPRRVVVSLGDPLGIGPEVIAKVLARSPSLARRCLVVGDPGVLARAVRRFAPAARRRAFRTFDAAGMTSGLPPAAPPEARWLEAATRLVLAGEGGALVTGPVTKARIARGLPGFRGQTEFIARVAGVREPVMMLAGPTLRAVCVTRHIPLRRVPGALTVPLIAGAVVAVARGLPRWFGIRAPRIAVCGLNPHAGEGGLLGEEDRRIVLPAVRAARRRGARATDPLPADAAFALAAAGRYDAVVAMYHDQANIPVKTVERDRAVNVTLGLPFLRTSPAHGTAYDIAGRGVANPESMRAAFELAAAATRA